VKGGNFLRVDGTTAWKNFGPPKRPREHLTSTSGVFAERQPFITSNCILRDMRPSFAIDTFSLIVASRESPMVTGHG
jgi:hypothetical protein